MRLNLSARGGWPEGYNAIVAKDVARVALVDATVGLSNSVTKVAGGDLQILVSSGLELRRRPQTVVLGTPSNLVITPGNVQGQLKTKVDAVKGAKSYVAKYTIDPQTPASQWASVTCTIRECVLTGLQSGAKYWIVVGAVGGYGKTQWGAAQLSPFVP